MEKLAKSVKSALRAEEDSMQGDDLGDDLAKMLEGMVKGSVRPTAPAVPIKQEPSGSFDRMGIVAQSSNALRCRLQSLLQAETLQRSLPRELGSRLDARVAHRLLVGDLRVFKGKTEKKAVDTAVHLLLDVSRSMAAKNTPWPSTLAPPWLWRWNPFLTLISASPSFPSLGGITMSGSQRVIAETG
jgi:hypothetical protein